MPILLQVCKRYFKFVKDTFNDIKTNYIDTGKVKFTYKNFPLPSHKDAINAALAAECANEQGKFWEMHDILYNNQNDLAIKDLKRYAKDLNLDTTQFDSCLDSSKYQSEIESDMEEGIGLGVTATPSFIINGRLVKGAVSYDKFQEVIEEELSK